MNRETLFLLTITFFFSQTLFSQPRSVESLRTGWKFTQGAREKGADPNADESEWEDVTVPHDWAIAGPFIPDGDGSTGKLPWKGEGWYRRRLAIPSDLGDRQVYLIFDGVMAFPKVYINGDLAGEWDYGYNSFYLNITPFLRPGADNLLAVHADTRKHDSRWYPGAGIYRKVKMLTVNPVHVDIWGTYLTTPVVKPHYADVRVHTTVNNLSAGSDSITVSHRILSPQGRPVARGELSDRIDAGTSKDLGLTITLPNPQRWDIDDPALYTLETTVQTAGRITDVYQTPFGVRTLRFDPDHGFYLNDRRVQLKGVNLHHDHGPLGAAFYPRAMERQLEIMKDMGVNAIRNSHNTAAPELAELCDRMGLLFFNEIFDKYDAKADITEETDFESFAHRNIRNFVVRDRNHPSVFLWSAGNEIVDVELNRDNGFARLHTMLNYIDKYDPTRPTTLVNHIPESAHLRHFDYYDVHCWNYDRRYALARQMEPNKPVIISESASTVSTRGFYEFPLPEEKSDFTRSLQVSSYDLNTPWWAEVPDDDFMWQQEESYIAGEFVWTGFDYLGEPTPYQEWYMDNTGMTGLTSSRSSYFGIVDLVGIPKDRFYLYKSYWKPEETTLHILPHWNWPDRVGQEVPVFVYTNGDCAELFLNGESLGMKCKDPRSDSSVERFRLMWRDVIYAPGELRAVAYREGVEIEEKVTKTVGEPARLRLQADRTALQAGGMDLSYVLVEAVDEEGHTVPLADHRLNIELEGEGVLAGAGNGNPRSFEPLQDEEVDLFFGKAMLIIRSGETPGTIRLSVHAEGLEGEDATLEVR